MISDGDFRDGDFSDGNFRCKVASVPISLGCPLGLVTCYVMVFVRRSKQTC